MFGAARQAWYDANPSGASYTISYLVVAGGGGGGTNTGGGGGAGGYIANSFAANTSTVYTITIGAGGAGGAAAANSGSTGANTTVTGTGLTTITAVGGGGGGSVGLAGLSGGSAGGSDSLAANSQPGLGTPVSGQGNYGGRGWSDTPGNYVKGGGGGGAGSEGSYATSNISQSGTFGDGGGAYFSSITGANVSYAGGGGGGAYMNQGGYSSTAGIGGKTTIQADKGGGGNGIQGNPSGPYPDNTAAVGLAGTPNTGGGQGGGSGGGNNNAYTDANGRAGAGGSGVVIFSLPTASYSGTYTGANVGITTSGSNTILSFYSSGTYTA